MSTPVHVPSRAQPPYIKVLRAPIAAVHPEAKTVTGRVIQRARRQELPTVSARPDQDRHTCGDEQRNSACPASLMQKQVLPMPVSVAGSEKLPAFYPQPVLLTRRSALAFVPWYTRPTYPSP